MTLKELIASTESVDLKILGKTFKARVLSTADISVLRRINPEPLPPMKKDPSKGSQAPEIEDRGNPAFRAAVEAWWLPYCVECVAIAIGKADPASLGISDGVEWPGVQHTPTPDVEARCRQFLDAARPVVSALPTMELLEAAKLVREGMDGLVESAEKKSSSDATSPSGDGSTPTP